MKKHYLLSLMTAFLLMAGFTSCESDNVQPPQPDGSVPEGLHFDVFLSVGKHGGMGRPEGIFVKSVSSLLDDKTTIDIIGDGTEFKSDENVYTLESITDDQYYYQVPESKDRFTKLRILDKKIEVVQECPFKTNTFNPRQYTHAWIDANTLVIMAANGEKDQIIWTKINTSDMTIISEGTLDLKLPQDATFFTSSGILTYHPESKRLYYFYFGKKKVKTATGAASPAVSDFQVATITPDDMKIIANEVNPVAAQMAGSAYGELMQNCVMQYKGDIYLAAFDNNDMGQLIRLRNGQTNFDAQYVGFKHPKGKLLTIQSLGNGKALGYVCDKVEYDKKNPFAYYYTIIDLTTGEDTPLSYEGKEIPYSSGRFSQRTVVVGTKAYIGVNTEDNTCIYIYDIPTGKVTLGSAIGKGYYFDILRVMRK